MSRLQSFFHEEDEERSEDEDLVTYHSGAQPLSFRQQGRGDGSEDHLIWVPALRARNASPIRNSDGYSEVMGKDSALHSRRAEPPVAPSVNVDVLFKSSTEKTERTSGQQSTRVLKRKAGQELASSSKRSADIDRPAHWGSGGSLVRRSDRSRTAPGTSMQVATSAIAVSKAFSAAVLPQSTEITLGRPTWATRRAVQPVIMNSNRPPIATTTEMEPIYSDYSAYPTADDTVMSPPRPNLVPTFHVSSIDAAMPASHPTGHPSPQVATSSPLKSKGKQSAPKVGSLRWKLQKCMRDVSSVNSGLFTGEMQNAATVGSIHDPRSRFPSQDGVVTSIVDGMHPFLGVMLQVMEDAVQREVLLFLPMEQSSPRATIRIGEQLTLFDIQRVKISDEWRAKYHVDTLFLCSGWTRSRA